MRSVQFVARGVREAFRPDGIRLMQFNGPAAGQTVFHIHMHIVPCYEGIPFRPHGSGTADAAVLEEQAARLSETIRRLQNG